MILRNAFSVSRKAAADHRRSRNRLWRAQNLPVVLAVGSCRREPDRSETPPTHRSRRNCCGWRTLLCNVTLAPETTAPLGSKTTPETENRGEEDCCSLLPAAPGNRAAISVANKAVRIRLAFRIPRGRAAFILPVAITTSKNRRCGRARGGPGSDRNGLSSTVCSGCNARLRVCRWRRC